VKEDIHKVPASPCSLLVGLQQSDRQDFYSEEDVTATKSCHKHVNIHSGPIKNVAFYFCPYLCQLLTDFQYSFPGTLCGQFATT